MLIPVQRWRAALFLGTFFGIFLAALAFVVMFLASSALLLFLLNR